MEKVKVMVVDDSRISRMMVSSMLAKTNFEVCAMAENSAEAVALYAKTKPDVVTMDMNLPDADGIECTRRIHAIDPKAKIVMISAMKDAKLIMQGRMAGIGSFLQKPVSTNELIDTLMIMCNENVGAVAVYRESYVTTFAKVLQQSLVSIFGIQSEIEISQNEESVLHVDGVAAVIGIVGEPKGRVALYMDSETMYSLSKAMLGMDPQDDLSADEAEAAIEEAGNIITGRAVSRINDVFKDKEMRITPPGTVIGSDIILSNPELISFNVVAKTSYGNVFMNVGFARGV
ncbi:Chemotaxis phosphatase CheX [Anaerovibrio lipolyticus DSM 3074]|uniref:Histidine kinase n=2 Tax=Anaerovibrio lipolyticus TaxID=82374 RepID=A0A0B2K1J7_9FIRM|nr:response regulator [Anaerovibrio lipolyticus]KHM52748.1 histidine kinase [Anaerovibrio lipolyticus]SHI36249.1 Chemotaxis phosphatase CheX [Anaerovibrio lipolyticus DSM 3074]